MPALAWMDQAWAEVGQREGPGSSDNARVLALYRDAGHPEVEHDEVAWCAAFVGASLERAGIACTRSLLARSYLAWGTPLAIGRLGAVAVFSRGGDASAGHVAFFLDQDATHIHVLGGNQNDAVGVAAIAKERLLGLRWPASAGSAATPAVPAAAPASAQTTRPFDVALAHVLEMEGGWTEDPYDPGGPTNLGITLATLAAHRNIHLDQTTFPTLREQLRNIQADEVQAIYLGRYWTPCRAALLPVPIAIMHFDAAVNHGVAGAARMLQEAANVATDGEIGPQTLAACAATEADRLLQRYADLRRARYRALPTFWRFGRGWLARVDATLAVAGRTLSASRGVPSMNDQQMPAPSAAQPSPPSAGITETSKWWGESVTVWGALITGLATVVPALGPVIGIDVSGEMIRQLGTQSVHAVQAIGGVVGTLMTIYGRVRATSRIGLKSVTLQI